ncbi:MAG: hypothetical protein Kow0010_10670 [Dehalococcoidia bacterium]
MNDVEELVHEVERRGIVLRPAGARLRYEAPRGALDDGLKARLLAHKWETLRELAPRCRCADRCGGQPSSGRGSPARYARSASTAAARSGTLAMVDG